MTLSDLIDDPERHTFRLQALPLEVLMEHISKDLWSTLDELSDPTCYTSFLILPPVMLIFRDLLSSPAVTSEQATSELTH